MKKVIGIFFSTIGNIGVLLTFLAVLVLPVFNVLTIFNVYRTFDIDWIIIAVLAGISLLCYIFAKIGNKVEDIAFEQGGYLKLKRTLIKVCEVILFNKLFFVIYIFMILGYVVLSGCSLLEMIGSPVVEFNIPLVDMCVNACALIFTMSFAMGIYDNYPLRHCPYCGGSYSGGGYEYEEEERSYHVNNDGKVRRTSKIRFAITCPICNMEHVYRRKMSTNAEAIEKFANMIIK